MAGCGSSRTSSSSGVFRHPARVARSLASRPKLQVEDPVELWRVHNALLLEQHRRSAFPIVCFDDDSDVLARNFDRVAELLGLAPPTEDEPFFTDDLRGMRRGAGGAAGRRARALRRAARARALKVRRLLVSAIRVTRASVRPFRRETVTSHVRRVITWTHGPSPPSSAHGVGAQR